MVQKSTVAVLAVVLCASILTAETNGSRNRSSSRNPPPTFADVKYDTKHERNVLDFWQAETDKPTPVVVFFHGGGFRTGDKKQIRRNPILREFLCTGVSFASCNYPFLKDASYGEIMRHCARAIQFLRSKGKEWRIDGRRIGAFGGSAGALISEWLAYHKDLGNRRSRDPVERFSTRVAVAGGLWQPMGTDLLVMQHMRAGGPPLFMYTNAPPSDRLHHPKYAKMIKAKADNLRIPAVLYGGDKNDIPPPPAGVTPTVAQLKFFCKHLRVKYPRT